MFDIFPNTEGDAIPHDAIELFNSLKKHVESEFSGLPKIKLALFSAIGYVKKLKKSPKDKIEERLEVLKSVLVGDRLEKSQLKLIISHATKVRNYFVHGTEVSKLTPEQVFRFQGLFIDTLEYIYAMSELIDCGWKNEYAPLWGSYNKTRSRIQQINIEVEDLRTALELNKKTKTKAS
jgi:hypothetical protein